MTIFKIRYDNVNLTATILEQPVRESPEYYDAGDIMVSMCSYPEVYYNGSGRINVYLRGDFPDRDDNLLRFKSSSDLVRARSAIIQFCKMCGWNYIDNFNSGRVEL